ncbi:MAG: MptD family putative ECF transporter S component, partial [Oscillospiraceae bacterium]|nr:MptD family putative ECF transporter S component [Oscillospiraceae bacterium]
MPAWMCPVMFAAAFVCGVIGGLLGRALLKKHFEKAGIA